MERVITSFDIAVVEIERALQAKLYYLALICTLSLIDICAALESENGETNRPTFIAWYDKNLAPTYTWLTGQDCYGLRCGMLHQGVLDHSVKNAPKSRWARIGFILPDGNGNEFRQIANEDHCFTGLSEFCRDVVARVVAWRISKKDDPIVVRNAAHLMRIHPRGIAPHVIGLEILS